MRSVLSMMRKTRKHWTSHFGLIALLSMTYANVLKESGKKFVNSKRAIDPYSYPVPAISFNEIPGQSKVTGQTTKPISSSQFGSSGGYAGSNAGTVPGTSGSIGGGFYNAFAQGAWKRPTTGDFSSTGSTTSYNTQNAGYGGFRTQGGSGAGALASTGSSTPARVTNGQPGSQYNSNIGSGLSGSGINGPTQTGGGNVGNIYGGNSANAAKIPSASGQTQLGGRPQGTGFSGPTGGSFGFNSATNLSGSGGGSGGMMGASYMRSSSPFYNFHVMLD